MHKDDRTRNSERKARWTVVVMNTLPCHITGIRIKAATKYRPCGQHEFDFANGNMIRYNTDRIEPKPLDLITMEI